MTFRVPDNIPTPTDLLDIIIDAVIKNSYNLYELNKNENLKYIADLTPEGKQILIKIVGGFNFYFENIWMFLSAVHPSIMAFDKSNVYTEKKQELINFILSKIKDARIQFDEKSLTDIIGREDLE